MSDGFQFFDIILFAMIAVFLVLRLRNVLGRRGGHEDSGDNSFLSMFDRAQDKAAKERGAGASKDKENVVHLGNAAVPPLDDDEELTPLAISLMAIAEKDRAFNPDEFVSGARIAFELVLGAYASGDADALRPLLSDEVFANFERSIRQREEAGQTMEETLIGIRKAEIIEGSMEGTTANVTVKFVSDQVHALYDGSGKTVEGNANKVINVTDFWTFSRDTKSRDPNWMLSATRSMD
ncbi:MAG: Tim44 domain-containing protein [Rhodospirillaceae bacterium]|nr:Tim44 domain-containing protein [Rhodospirillaceae bacterium]